MKIKASFRLNDQPIDLKEFSDKLTELESSHREHLDSFSKRADAALVDLWNQIIEDELKRTKAQQKKELSDLTALLKEMLEIDLVVVMALKDSFMFELKEYGAISYRNIEELSNMFETFEIVVTTIISADTHHEAYGAYSEGPPTVVEVTVSKIAEGKIQQVISSTQASAKEKKKVRK